MHPNSFESLEWSGLLGHYSSHCLSVPAKATALSITPAQQIAEAIEKIERTGEALHLLEGESFIALGKLQDLNSPIDRIEKSLVIDGKELFGIAQLASISSQLKSMIKNPSTYPRLYSDAALVPELSHLADPIFRAIDDDGNVQDSASATLRLLREQERKIHLEAREKLDQILQKAFRDGHLQDKFYDFRDGRYLIPVRSEARNKLAGFVVESSSTKATVFMEPAALRDANDKLKQILLLIEEEIYRILQELSQKLHPHAPQIRCAYSALIEFDLCFARASFAAELSRIKGVSKPAFSDKFVLDGLYHPLLGYVIDREKIIRNSFKLGPKNKVLIISGPNTGGKTVLLKAVGLVALMAKCGFYLPCAGEAELPFFDQILAQVGDSQNLELSLSSFSGSVMELKRILDKSSENSLVLVDEILHATDPDEATALARSILECLESRGAYCVITTHLNGLKVTAATGFESASMEFNAVEISPTYRLRSGVPGSSRALEIAQRLGLPLDIIDRARSYLSAERMEEQRAVDKLELREKELAEAKSSMAAVQAELESEREMHKVLNQELHATKVKFRSEAMDKIKQQQQEAISSLDELIRSYKSKLQNIQEKHEASLEAQANMDKLRDKFQAIEKSINEIAPPIAALIKNENAPNEMKLQKNGVVFVRSMQTEGVLLSNPHQGTKAEVAIGKMRVRVPWEQLEPRANILSPPSPSKLVAPSSSECSPEIKLIGMTVDQAMDALSLYLDQAMRSGRHEIRIVHGHGSGALKNAVRQILSKSPYELKFRPGLSQEGGDGCTIVEFT